MPRSILIFTALLLCITAGAQKAGKEYYKVPCKEAFYVSESHYGYRKMARQITEGCKSAYEKIAAIYDWETRNIAYDTSYSIRTADECLDAKKGVCQAYCELFYQLATAVGVKVEIIQGISKDIYGNVQSGGHAWIFAYTRGNYGILLDPTWGAGSVNGRTFTFRENPRAWFDVDPEWMIFSHFPNDASYQLLEKPLTVTDFGRLPNAPSECAEYGLDVHKLFTLARRGKLSLPQMYSGGDGDFKALDIPLQETLRIGQSYHFKVWVAEGRHFALADPMLHPANSEEWTAEGNGVYSLDYTPTSSQDIILCYYTMTGPYSWSTAYLIRYKVH